MPSEGSDLPTVKQCKFEQLTSKSDAESVLRELNVLPRREQFLRSKLENR